MRIAARKDVARDDEQIPLDRLGDEFAGGAPRGAGEGVEGALGIGKVEVILQGVDNHVALAAVGVDLGGQVLVEGDDPAVLRHARRRQS